MKPILFSLVRVLHTDHVKQQDIVEYLVANLTLNKKEK